MFLVSQYYMYAMHSGIFDQCTVSENYLAFGRSKFARALSASINGISESVDSLCRNDADTQYMQYMLPTNTVKAYLSASLPDQKPCRRQLNAKVCSYCGSKSAIFLYSFFLLCSTTITKDWFEFLP